MEPSIDNFWRGASIEKYYIEIVECLNILKNDIDCYIILKIIHHEIDNPINKPLLVHGDIALGNIIYNNNSLN